MYTRKIDDMETKISIGVPVEIILDIVRMINSGGMDARLTISSPDLGQIWFELIYTPSNDRQLTAIRNIMESVTQWNQLRYGNDSAAQVYKDNQL